MAEKSSDKTGLDTRLAKSVSHPIRIEVMRILNERTASPSELAAALGQGVSHVSYHVQELNKYGCVELVRAEPRRGAVEHFYRAKKVDDSPSRYVGDSKPKKLSRAQRAELFATTLQTVIGETLGAVRSGSLDARADSHASWIAMDLDEEGWSEMTALLASTLEKAGKIEAKCAKRLSSGDVESFPALVSLIAFERSGNPAGAPTGDVAK